MPGMPSFQNLLGEFSDEVFVGRGEQLTLFEQVFKVSHPPFLILGVSGQGGVGKSTLLQQYQHIAESCHAYSALVNEDYVTIPLVLSQFVKQFDEQDVSFSGFKERYHRYLELKEQVEADPKAPSGLLDFALRSATRVGLRSLKRIPVAGEFMDVLVSPEAENVIAEQTSAFYHYVSQKFKDKDDKVLLLETDSELTKYFLSDLNKFADLNKVVLFFDTYEKTASGIEDWLINMLHGNFGSFSGNTLFVVAGRYSLGQAWMEFKRAIRQIQLQEFTVDEAKEYLTRSGITDEKQITQLIEISNRLPILLALLASSPSNLPENVAGDAVERFLIGKTLEQREAALFASLPRYFNQDILSAILGKEEGEKAFAWLSEEHFVRSSEQGWAYHDVVRSLMLRYLHVKSSETYATIHKKLHDYYMSLTNGLELSKEKQQKSNQWRKYELERLYHFFSENPPQHIEYIAKMFTSGTLEILEAAFNNQNSDNDAIEGFEILASSCTDILIQVAEETSEPTLKVFADQYKKLITLFDSDLSEQLQQAKDLFTWLANVDGLNKQEKGVAYLLLAMFIADLAEDEVRKKDCLNYLNIAINLSPDYPLFYEASGQVLTTIKDYPAAVVNITKAIQLQPENGYNYQWRGRAYYEMEDYPSALTDFTKAIQLQPENDYHYYWRGRTHLKIKNYPAALADFQKSTSLDSEDDLNFYMRGLSQKAQGNDKSFEEDIQTAIRLFHLQHGDKINECQNTLTLALYTLANGEDENAKTLYQHAIHGCVERDVIKNGISRLEEYIGFNPSHEQAKSILESLNNSLDNLINNSQ